MMDVTVKTLDGQNRSFCVPENITVKQFKEKIAASINIEADIQRLIFQGRVLQDEKLLKDYDVHGKVIHVVQRPPPSTRPPGASGTSTTSSSTPGAGSLPRDANSYVVGSFTIPSDIIDPNQVQQIVQNAVQNMGEMGRNARVSTRASNDGSSVDVHINLGANGGPARVESESQLRINNARRMLEMARGHLTTLENAGQASGSSADTASSSRSSATAGTQESQTDQSESMETQETETSSQSNGQTQTTGTSTEPETAETSTQTSGTTQSNSTTESSTNTQPRSQPNSHPPGLIRPPITTVADVLQEVLEVNQRLQPFLVRYQTLTRNDPQVSGEELTEAQQLCNLVGEILHTISHCYHSLSDLMIDLSQPPPRHLYAAFISQQAQINIGPMMATGPSVQRTSGTQSNIPTNTAGTQANQPETNSTGTQSSVSTASASTSTTGVPAQTQAGVNIAQPSDSVDDDEDSPMFIEMGPEIVSVASVTAHVVPESENPTTSSANTGTTTTEQHIFPGGAGGHVTNDLIQSIVNSVLQAHVGRGGPRFGPPGAVQIEVGPTGIHGPFRFPRAPGAGRMNASTSPTTSTSTSASGTQTNSTDSTNTSGTQTGAQNTSETQTQTHGRPRTTAFVMPGLPGAGFPGMGIGGLPGLGMPGFPPPVDPYLPCSSRYFFRQQARLNEQQNRANGATSQTRNGGSGQPANENQNGSQANRGQGATNNPSDFRMLNPNASMNHMVNTFMSQILDARNPHLNGQATTANTAGNQTTTTSTGTSGTGTTGTSSNSRRSSSTPSTDPLVQMLHEASSQMPGVIGIQVQGMQDGQPVFSSMFGMPPRPGHPPPQASMPRPGTQPSATGEQNYATMLRDFLQSASTHQRTTSGSTNTTNTGTTSSQQSAPMSDEAFTRLVSGIGSMVTQSAIGQPSSQPISEFLSTLGEDINASDGSFVNDLFRCVSRHLSIPDLLQVFYGTQQPLNRLRNPLREFIRGRVLNDGEPTPENIAAGVDRLVRDMQQELKNAEEATEVKPDIDFVATLSNIFRVQLIATIRMIMQSESQDTQFGRNLYERVRQALSEVIVLTRYCLVGGRPALERLVQNRLENITRGVNPLIQQWMGSVSTQQLNTFIPTITVTEEQVTHYIVKKSTSTESPMETSSVLSSPGASAMHSPQSMDVESKNESKPSPSGAVNIIKEPVNSTEPAGAAAVGTPVVNGAMGGEPSTSSANGSDNSWQKEVPEEWVPVINGDIQKQKNQRHQPPFSDAYNQGMPAKRRKLNGPTESSNRAENFSNSIRRAAQSAGVEPISNMENLTKEVEENTEVLNEYDENMRNSIIQRLQTDTDFVPNRFPKSSEYFKTNNKK